jgi:multidrug efflux pump subunit AcrA (membrane-fusion protein)
VSFLEKTQPPASVAQSSGVLAPAAAIVSRDGKTVAFVVQDETVSQRSVKVGRSLGDDREVLDGLAGGDSVVLDPPQRLSDGDRVRIAAAGD